MLMKSSLYTTAVDIWSVGCIFGSLFLRAPLFLGAVAYRCGVNGRRTKRCCIRFFTCLERRRKRTGPFSIEIRFLTCRKWRHSRTMSSSVRRSSRRSRLRCFRRLRMRHAICCIGCWTTIRRRASLLNKRYNILFLRMGLK